MSEARWNELWQGPSLDQAVRASIAERVVRWVLAPLWLVSLFACISIFLSLGFTEPTRYVPSLIFWAASGVITLLGRRGRWLAAATTLTLTVTVAVVMAVLLNSVYAPAYWAGLMLLSLVVPLFGVRWGIASALVLAAAGAGWFALHEAGFTNDIKYISTDLTFALYVGYLFISLIIVRAPHRLLVDALIDAQRKREEAEHARAAEAASELAFHAVFDQASVVMLLLTADGRVVQENHRAATLLGASDEPLVGRPLVDASLWTTEQRALLEDAVARAAAGEVTRHELTVSGRPGATGVFQVTVSPFHTQTGSLGYVIVEAVDVSDLVEARSMLAQARRLEALGQLSGGVAHDLNNMLGAISGACELVRRAGKRGEAQSLEANVNLIQSSVMRAASLTKQLLAFGSQDRFSSEPLDVMHLVSDIGELLQRTLRKNIRVLLEPGAPGNYVRGDAAALEHALLNLALNAQDAMPNGGSLTIACNSQQLTAADCAALGAELMPGATCVISVIDTGTGMSRELCERIFEPFFTTKGAGKGTGLGLSAVHGTVRSHHGAIRVRSREGYGTTFELYLPASAPPFSKHKQSSDSIAAWPHAHVLLADDEALVRQAVAALLESFGCTVQALESGDLLLRALRDGANPDLIVTDLAMPGLSGSALVQAIEAAHPDCPLLLITGFTGDDISSANGRRLLRKPFRRNELGRVLQELLTETGSTRRLSG